MSLKGLLPRTGIEFDPSSTVTIKFDENTVGTVTTDSNGEFDASFTVPPSSSGSKTVAATQGSNSASKTFTVTNTTTTGGTSPY